MVFYFLFDRIKESVKSVINERGLSETPDLNRNLRVEKAFNSRCLRCEFEKELRDSILDKEL